MAQTVLAMVLALVGIVLAFVLVRDLRSGRSRLSGTSFYRSSQPVAYWASIFMLALFAGGALWSAARVLIG